MGEAASVVVGSFGTTIAVSNAVTRLVEMFLTQARL